MRAVDNLAGLRVCFVVGTLGQGGAERQLYYIIRTLQSHGAAPVVLTLARGEFWEERLVADGVPVEWVGASRGRGARLSSIVRCARRYAPEVIQSFHFYTNLYASLAGRLLRVPDIGALRSDGTGDFASVGGWLGRVCLHLPRLVVANSQPAIDNVAAMGVARTRLHLLPNVIDTEAFACRAPEPHDAFEMVAVGRLGPEKRFDRLLRCVATVRARRVRPVALTIAGHGPLRAELEALAASLDIADAVTFLGSVDDIRPVLARADCLVLTSDAEGTPNVILEAMATGRPVIATAVGGVPALVHHGDTGFLAPVHDEAALADRVEDLASDDRLARAMGRRGRAVIEQTYAWTGLGERLVHLYARVAPHTSSS